MSRDAAPIAIAGAGIAGLTSAIALKIAGFSVALFEREAEVRPIGAGIQLGPNATRVLARLGVELPASACRPRALEFRNPKTGRLLNAMPLGTFAEGRYGAPYLTMLRADLQAALMARAAELAVPIAFGAAVTAADDTEDALAITAGRERRRVAALIGADGLRSTVRTFVDPDVVPVYTGTLAWRTVLSAGAAPVPLREAISLWMAPGAHLVHYPVAGGEGLNAVLAVECDCPEYRGDSSLSRGAERWPYFIREALRSADWAPWPVFQVPLAAGGKGRMQLVGDAWHAMPPFLASGAAMALEDASALAKRFLEADGAITYALRRFREERLHRLRRVMARSLLMGRLYHLPHWLGLVRDAAIRGASHASLLARHDWLYQPKA